MEGDDLVAEDKGARCKIGWDGDGVRVVGGWEESVWLSLASLSYKTSGEVFATLSDPGRT